MSDDFSGKPELSTDNSPITESPAFRGLRLTEQNIDFGCQNTKALAA
jgi:hypothetical protein